MHTQTLDCCEPLRADHRRTEQDLAALTTQFETLKTGPEPTITQQQAVRASITALLEDLRAHFLREEYALFPMIHPIRSMILLEVEHDDLMQAMTTLDAACQPGLPFEAIQQPFETLATSVRAHILEEERGVFPRSLEWLGPTEHQTVLQRMSALQAEQEQAQGWMRCFDRRRPTMQVDSGSRLQPFERPIAFSSCFESGTTDVQHQWFATGQQTAWHWTPQDQWLLVLAGQVQLDAQTQPASTQAMLQAGQSATIGSRTLYRVIAQTDAHLLSVRVWPWPHYSQSKH